MWLYRIPKGLNLQNKVKARLTANKSKIYIFFFITCGLICHFCSFYILNTLSLDSKRKSDNLPLHMH